MAISSNSIKIAYIGGGSELWAPKIIRDIMLKPGMEQLKVELALLDLHEGRAQAIKALFDVKMAQWGVDHVQMYPTLDSEKALAGADFVIITISTGRLEAMAHDLAIPERYGIYQTVGDTCGPGAWSRTLRNIPIFQAYAEQIKRLCPDAYVLNYSNPMGTLTKVLADEIGGSRVVGLCHGLFECYHILRDIFELGSEDDIRLRFGGLNHFFWILDFSIQGEDGYKLLHKKLQGRNFAELLKEIHTDEMGWSSDKWLAGELLANYDYLPYVGDRHTCEFFNSLMTSKKMQEEFKLVSTGVTAREKAYADAGRRIRQCTLGNTEEWDLEKLHSREAAVDIIRAVVLNQRFTDVVNLVNTGQIDNLPRGAVVETMGCVDANGFSALAVGPLPEPIRALVTPHAEVQIRTAIAGMSGDLNEALLALAADPICSHLSPSRIRQMGVDLLKANRQYLPQFFEVASASRGTDSEDILAEAFTASGLSRQPV